jgi:hypothetical protein
MIRLRDLLLTACAPLALRHALVEGRVPHDVRRAFANARCPARPAPAHATVRVMRLFAVQIR